MNLPEILAKFYLVQKWQEREVMENPEGTLTKSGKHPLRSHKWMLSPAIVKRVESQRVHMISNGELIRHGISMKKYGKTMV